MNMPFHVIAVPRLNRPPVILRRWLPAVMLCLASALLSGRSAGAAYDFLGVTKTGPKTSVFTSPNGNGSILVTSTGNGPSDNNIIGGRFTTLFPGNTNIHGHLAQLRQNETSTITFDFTSYALSPSLIFGLWNIMPSSQATYRIQVLDASNNLLAPPFTWTLIGNDDNTDSTDGVVGAYSLVLNPASGVFQTPFKGPGVHTDAAFWNNLPAKTRKIVVTGNLANAIDVDGVGSFFAEPKGFRFECGMAVVTCSSASRLNNFQPCGNGPSDLAPNAYVVAILDTRDPVGAGAPFGSMGGGWQPAGWHNDFSTTDAWNARNLGEVFGIALDDSSPPNVYVAATSIHFGNGRGPGGDGGVYKLNGTNYGISVFQDFTTSPKKIGKVSLGNICFDKEHRQLFVADLDNGLVRRLSTTGSEVLTGGFPYDHGVTGNANISAPAIPDSGTAGALTQSGRRVFAVQVFRSRLYYSVWFAPPNASSTGFNEVWSVGLQANGDLIPTGPSGPRREFTLVGLPPYSMYPGAEPVITDIAFSPTGTMLVGERSICTQDPSDLASGSHAARAIEYTYTTSWNQSQILNVGGVVVGSGRVNSAGGVDYDCSGREFVMGDALISSNVLNSVPFPYTGSAVYGLQIFPTPTSTVDNSWLVDLDGNFNIYDKLSLGDVEVYRCCDCIRFSNEVLQCISTNQFKWSFCYTNYGTLTNGHLAFLDLPPGVTTSPQIVDISPALLPGQGTCVEVIVTLAPGTPKGDLCFRVAAHTEDFVDCCIVPKCITVPECCGVVSRETVKCDPAGGPATWNFTLSNFSGTPVKYLYVIPDSPSCVSATPNVIVLTPALTNGGSANISVQLSVTNNPCDVACFRLAMHDTKFVACCAFTHCVSLKCKTDNHPPILDCADLPTLCDPAGGFAYKLSTIVVDPDGDPLTITWKIDNVPVATNTVPAGVSATPTPVQTVQNFTPGNHVITVCVSDGNGPLVICSMKLDVGDHQPPAMICPPGQTVEKWELPLPNYAALLSVSDNCTPLAGIRVIQEPAAGTVLGPGSTSVRFTARDAAGNSSICVMPIEVAPLRIVGLEAALSFPGLRGFTAPAEFGLGVAGDLPNTAAVEYFVNGSSIGSGTGAGFKLLWSKVAAGTYSVVAEGTRAGQPNVRSRSAPVYVLVLPGSPAGRAGGVALAVVRSGKVSLSIETTAGQISAVEVTDKLDGQSWQEIQRLTGDGTIQVVELDATGPAKFIRVRNELAR